MTIQRANPFGWFKNDVLSSSQINQIDTNSSNAIDKRDGYTDTVSSALTFDASSSLTFQTGTHLIVQDPTSIQIADGNLACGAAIIGAGKALRFGMTTITINSTNFTVAQADYTKHILILTGTLTGTTSVILPTLAGYSKLIDNQCIMGGYSLTVKTAAGTGVVIPGGKTGFVYCDGVNIVSGPIKQSYEVMTVNYKGETSSYGTQYQHITTNTYTDLSGYQFVFTDVKANDIFEITYTAGAVNTDISGTTYVCVANTQTGFLNETIYAVTGTAQQTATFSTRYVSSINDSAFVLGLVSKVDSAPHDGYVMTPLTFYVKQIRP